MGERTPIKVTQAPLGNGIPRALIIVVVALIVIVVLFAVVPFIENAFGPQTSVTLTNVVGPTTSGCTTGSSQNYYTYTWTFNLANTGNTNANVTVSIVPQSAQFSGASSLKNQVFIVPKASSPSETMSITLANLGCNKVTLAPQITAQKAV